MLDQKDNDFDDLFRRASDKYPLRTDSADWDRMSAALDDPSSSSAVAEMEDTDKRRKRRFLWFFLFLPLGGVGYYAMYRAGVGHGHAVATESVVKAPASGSDESGLGAGDAGAAGAGATGVGANGAVAGDADAAGDAGKGSGVGDASGSRAVGSGTVAGGAGKVSTSADGAGNTGGSATVTRGVSTAGGVIGGARSGVVDASKDGVVGASKGRAIGGARSGVVGASKDGMIGGAADGMAGEAGGGVVGAGAALRVANYPVNRAHISKDYNLTVNVAAPVIAKDSSKVKPKASSKQKSSFLYAGLLAAPDLSTVKFQSTNGVGTTFSLLLGYQFNKRWAVEAGVSLDRKKYYTSAEYFKLKPYVQPNQDLKSLDGTCYMWEIPINVRYNFSQSEKNKWFATAGLSTYLMTSENYNYNYDWWGPTGNTGTGSKPWDIKKPSQYWFSIINLSAGYEHRIGGIGNLRIEPYVRVPLTGVGTGKLNILSTGVNIGITRRLW
ncbi:MAG TPA: outer membrane beta-barrel protein [Puia sp.]|jgi:hypothetical protein